MSDLSTPTLPTKHLIPGQGRGRTHDGLMADCPSVICQRVAMVEAAYQRGVREFPTDWQPTGIVPAHNRAITDRLKAAERCVLAIQEALTGEKPDGVLDYDQACEHLLSRIGIAGLDGTIMLDPKFVDVATVDGRVVAYRYHGALPCPASQPHAPVDEQPPQGVTVTDRHGHRWIHVGAVWRNQDDLVVHTSWDTLAAQHGPLHTDGSPCPAPSPADPVE